MFRGPVLPCPACKRSYEAIDWIDANHCRCLKCQEDFEFFPFPALTAKAEVARPQAVALSEDSTCFFHAENQAEKVCDDCGRFLCAVCAVPFGGKVVCSSCIAKAKNAEVGLIASRVLPGGRALMLAVVPVFVQEQWRGRDPLGQAGVELRWRLPDGWNGEVFRVYSRQSGSGSYILIATVTSCSAGECV